MLVNFNSIFRARNRDADSITKVTLIDTFFINASTLHFVTSSPLSSSFNFYLKSVFVWLVSNELIEIVNKQMNNNNKQTNNKWTFNWLKQLKWNLKKYLPHSIEAIIGTIYRQDWCTRICFGHTTITFKYNDFGPYFVIDLIPFVENFLNVFLEKKCGKSFIFAIARLRRDCVHYWPEIKLYFFYGLRNADLVPIQTVIGCSVCQIIPIITGLTSRVRRVTSLRLKFSKVWQIMAMNKYCKNFLDRMQW